MNSEKLKEILERHELWLNSTADGQRADLRGADLRGAYLRGADLRRADLWGANLRGAYLRGADLRRADLWGANLRDADLRGAYLRGADLKDADLKDADLWHADLWGAKHAPITMHIGPWDILIHSGKMRIGCEIHTFQKWREFTDDEISEMEARALEFWHENKELLLTACDICERKNA